MDKMDSLKRLLHCILKYKGTKKHQRKKFMTKGKNPMLDQETAELAGRECHNTQDHQDSSLHKEKTEKCETSTKYTTERWLENPRKERIQCSKLEILTRDS